MNTQPTRAEKLFKRANGEEVRVVAEVFYGIGLFRSVGVYVQKRASGSSNWHTCNSLPHPNWKRMSVEQYKKEGRSEALQAATPGEILSVVALLEQPKRN